MGKNLNSKPSGKRAAEHDGNGGNGARTEENVDLQQEKRTGTWLEDKG
jgi:hypothetical protein